ncbi:hypothetical protein Taro_023224 [Colocasia esculenta]|uniref:Uncharacterized protein n=1 Tax=Colocasia esculenta TaxID=4460 RepID=A0A843VAS2_COLES|nr:hypothetical protein [Colocasia esculenta]
MVVQVYGVQECRDICRDGFGGPDGMAVHCNNEHQVLQTRLALLWKPQNCPTYKEAVWNCTMTEQKERKVKYQS